MVKHHAHQIIMTTLNQVSSTASATLLIDMLGPAAVRMLAALACRMTDANDRCDPADKLHLIQSLFACEGISVPTSLSCSCEPLATTPQPGIHTHPRAACIS